MEDEQKPNDVNGTHSNALPCYHRPVNHHKIIDEILDIDLGFYPKAVTKYYLKWLFGYRLKWTRKRTPYGDAWNKAQMIYLEKITEILDKYGYEDPK